VKNEIKGRDSEQSIWLTDFSEQDYTGRHETYAELADKKLRTPLHAAMIDCANSSQTDRRTDGQTDRQTYECQTDTNSLMSDVTIRYERYHRSFRCSLLTFLPFSRCSDDYHICTIFPSLMPWTTVTSYLG